VGPDEPGSAGDEHARHRMFLLRPESPGDVKPYAARQRGIKGNRTPAVAS
jgi:hypothetical protein